MNRLTALIVAYLGARWSSSGWTRSGSPWPTQTSIGPARPLLATGLRLAPAIAFYLIYLVGVMVLAVAPERADNRLAVVAACCPRGPTNSMTLTAMQAEPWSRRCEPTRVST